MNLNYQFKMLRIIYSGEQMDLSELTEENMGFFAKMLDHEYTSKEVFRKNFFDDLRKVL